MNEGGEWTPGSENLLFFDLSIRSTARLACLARPPVRGLKEVAYDA